MVEVKVTLYTILRTRHP